MTRFTNLGRRRCHTSSRFEGNPIGKNGYVTPGNEGSSKDRRLKNDKRTKLRRLRRIRDKRESLVCYRCRTKGHDLNSCPDSDKIESGHESIPREGNICYKCGSNQHKLSQCRFRGRSGTNELPYASCFVCGKKGHLAVKCPKNDHGLYPNGGSCHFCGSIEHLAVNCKLSMNKKIDKGIGSIILGQKTLNQGADDDDLHLVLNEKHNKPNPTQKRKRKNVVTM